MKRKLLTLLLALVSVTAAWAEDVVLTSSHTTWEDGNAYVLNDNVTISERVTVSGTVWLMLGEGFELKVPKGITLSSGMKLVIDGTGTLTIDNCNNYDAGIGAYEVGTLVINGGIINVRGGSSGAGLGGSIHNLSGGTIIINGGVVNATGGSGAAGIGGGWDNWAGNYGRCGDIIINGGQVTATAYGNAYAFGPGESSSGDTYQNGTIYLRWTNATDFIHAKGGAGGYSPRTGSIYLGKTFLLDGTETEATLSNISGQKIVPPISTVTPDPDPDPTPVFPSLKGDMNEDSELTIADVTILVDSVLAYKPAHEYVDLGLPSHTLWAMTNVGADCPEDYGDYFGWGETIGVMEGHDNFTWGTYQWCNGSQETMTKYCQNGSYGYNGYTDDLTELQPEDDAATVYWGAKWCMPSCDQMDELINSRYTTIEATTLNGVNGHRITSKSNGNSIFLPANGCYDETWPAGKDNVGCYWSRTIHVQRPYGAYYCNFSGISIYWTGFNRYRGMGVRPVRK